MTRTTLERVAAGDPAAVEQCLEKYGGLVWSLARRLCANHADAEDAVQEIFIDVWRNADRFDAKIGSEATYISMIARRRLIDQFRKRSRAPETTLIQEAMVESKDRHEDQAELREEVARARSSMEQLRPEQRQVLELSITQGLSQSQVAAVTNLPLGTVKTHARRGLIRLRELLGVESTATAPGGRE